MLFQHVGGLPYYSCDECKSDCGEDARSVADAIEVSHLPIDLATAFLYQKSEFLITQGRHVPGIGLGLSKRRHGVPGM
ncbi:hypothetical protein ACIQKE_02645 [Streptomyces griseoviridis]